MSERPCPVPGCERSCAKTRSTCEAHYGRMRKYGSYDLPPRTFAKDNPCKADGCDRPGGRAQGYCGKHWERVKRHGDPNVQLVILDDPARRFWDKVAKTDTCWLWTGVLTYDGYGIFGVNGERTGAHRWAWRLSGMEAIPEGMQLDHLCRVRNCVRPSHLEIVTPAENTRRAAAELGVYCSAGHAYRFDKHGHRICNECNNERRRERKRESA